MTTIKKISPKKWIYVEKIQKDGKIIRSVRHFESKKELECFLHCTKVKRLSNNYKMGEKNVTS